MSQPIISLIVARARNGVIGADGGLPWHLPEDLKFFKKTTMGKPIIMGRKTYESIGKPLPGRKNIVISRQKGYTAEGCALAHSLEEAIAAAGDAPELMIIGGAKIYALALPRADRLYVTEVALDIEGDAFFPDFDEAEWRETAREDHAVSDSHPAYSFRRLERVA